MSSANCQPIAVGIVLLLPEPARQLIYKLNRRAIKQGISDIILDNYHLPHISLCLGIWDQQQHHQIVPQVLALCGGHPKIDLLLDKCLSLGSTDELDCRFYWLRALTPRIPTSLHDLHRTVMVSLASFLNHIDPAPDMFMAPPDPHPDTLNWVDNFDPESSFENFAPRVTIGYGPAGKKISTDGLLPIKCTVSKLAIVHLGSHCTAQRIVKSFDLK